MFYHITQSESPICHHPRFAFSRISEGAVNRHFLGTVLPPFFVSSFISLRNFFAQFQRHFVQFPLIRTQARDTVYDGIN
jgi:hypothetical protein